MSKIVLNDVTNLNTLSVINDNFDKIELEFQNKALYRNNPDGEPNALQNDIDANGNSIYNVQDLTIQGSFTVNGKDLETVIDEATQGIEDNAIAAENAAVAAAASASAANVSANAAAASEANAQDSETAAAASESNAATSATNAASSASTATTQAGIATTKASEASTSASNAATSASTATTQAGIATTGASTATTKASEAAASASNASSSATAAASSAAAAAASAASIDPDSLLTKAGNLSGLASPATARDNLGVEIGVDVQAFNAALAAIAANNGTNAMKNRIINGAMMIDQRGSASAPITIPGLSSAHTVDQWRTFKDTNAGTLTAQQSSTAPVGFSKSLLHTVTTGFSAGVGDYLTIVHSIEGSNVADLNCGTLNAATVTLSFWVRSSIAGTYAASITNAANSRSYVATYTINSANTFEYKTINVPLDTTGTWLTDNNAGIRIRFDLGSGSNFNTSANTWVNGTYTRTSGCVNWTATTGATFYVAGVQLEKGSTATSFDYRPYGTELALCQRYYQTTGNGANPTNAWGGYSGITLGASQSFAQGLAPFKVSMRAAPTVILYDNIGASVKVTQSTVADGIAATTTTTNQSGFYEIARTTGTFSNTLGTPINAGYTASAEL